MPGTLTESFPDEECADGDGDGERDEGPDRADGENGADSDFAGEDEENKTAADEDVEPDGVDGGLRNGVYACPEAGEGEATVTGVGEGDSRGGDHAALTHGESGDNGQAEAGEGGVLSETLKEESGPGLAEV